VSSDPQKPLLLLTEGLHAAARPSLEAHFEILESGPHQWRSLSMLPEVKAILLRTYTSLLPGDLDLLPALKLVARAGNGLDHLPVDALSSRKISIVHTPDSSADSAAELSCLLILNLFRRVHEAEQSLRAGQWRASAPPGCEIRGKTLGIVGLGRIGSRVAYRLKAFGMRVLACDPYLTAAQVQQRSGDEQCSLGKLLEASDVVSLHLPLRPQTRHLLSVKEFSKMKKGSFLVNASRGQVIDEKALIQALQSGSVSGVALDVFSEEPLPADHPLLHLKNVILTPHIGAFTVEARQRVDTDIVNKILEYFFEPTQRRLSS